MPVAEEASAATPSATGKAVSCAASGCARPLYNVPASLGLDVLSDFLLQLRHLIALPAACIVTTANATR